MAVQVSFQLSAVLQPDPEVVVVVGVQAHPGQQAVAVLGPDVHPEPGGVPHPRAIWYRVAEVAGAGEPRHRDDQPGVAGLAAVAERTVAGEPVLLLVILR